MGFRLVKVDTGTQSIQTCIITPGNEETKENYYTVLIGRNGTGKSRLLANICHAFNVADNSTKKWNTNLIQLNLYENEEITIHSKINRKKVEISLINKELFKIKVDESFPAQKDFDCLPRRVIATTVSPFDKFPIDGQRLWQDEDHENDDKIYRYLGSKNSIGQISGTGKISRVIESLIFASEKNQRKLNKLSQVFQFLGYCPRITVDYTLKFPRKAFYDLEEMLKSKKPVTSEYLIQAFKQKGRRTSIESNFSKNPEKFLEDFSGSLQAILGDIDYKTYTGLPTIDFDFESAQFLEGSLDVFKKILFLRKLSLLSLANLHLRKKDPEGNVNLRDTSSGEQGLVLTFLGIASEIEDDSLIIIDEPEISLHPEWQERFIDLLTSIFSGYKGCHFILATHSPLIISRLEKQNCAVVSMENLKIIDAAELSKKSVDYQLANAFENPGFHNEYLAREGLSALRLASHRDFGSDKFQEKIALLTRLRPKLEDDDPVAQITDALLKIIDEVSK